MRCPICGADSDNPKSKCCMDLGVTKQAARHREWKVALNERGEIIYSLVPDATTGIHVIEYAALDEALKENERLRKHLELRTTPDYYVLIPPVDDKPGVMKNIPQLQREASG